MSELQEMRGLKYWCCFMMLNKGDLSLLLDSLRSIEDSWWLFLELFLLTSSYFIKLSLARFWFIFYLSKSIVFNQNTTYKTLNLYLSFTYVFNYYYSIIIYLNSIYIKCNIKYNFNPSLLINPSLQFCKDKSKL